MTAKKTIKKSTSKNKGGRPSKFDPAYVDMAYNLCKQFGANDKGLAEFFKVCEDTINEWKHVYPLFSESLKKGKQEFDSNRVVGSLLERALGYEHEEIKYFAHEGIVTDKRTVIKRYPPDVGAIVFYLKNRMGRDWKDKIDHGISADGLSVNIIVPEGRKPPEGRE